MSYTIAKMGPTQGQKQDLLKGLPVLLSPQHLQGPVPVPLTRAQVARYTVCVKDGKKMTLKLSSRQISAVHKHGEGFGEDAGLAALSLAKPGIKAGLDAAQAAIPTAELGPMKPIGDMAVGLLRKGLDAGLGNAFDALEAKLKPKVADPQALANIINNVKAAAAQFAASQKGKGWQPMTSKKKPFGRGLRL